MAETELRNRAPAQLDKAIPAPELSAGAKLTTAAATTSGNAKKEKHGRAVRILRGLSANLYFLLGCIVYV